MTPMNAKTALVLGCVAGLLSVDLRAEDWPQYRGANHDGASHEKILTAWPATGLKQIWKTPLKDGFSSFTVATGKAFTIVTRDVDGANQEVCVALDAATGKELWAAPLGVAKFDGGGDSGTPDNSGGDGPRSTPSFDNGKLYTYSSRMVLKCFDAATGKDIWSADMIKEHAGQNIHWESAASPLIDGSLIYVAGGGAGQALMAFDKNDGHLVWKGQSDSMTQSTPVVVDILGTRQVIFFTQTGLVAVTADKGVQFFGGIRSPTKLPRRCRPLSPGTWFIVRLAMASVASRPRLPRPERVLPPPNYGPNWATPKLVNHWSTPQCIPMVICTGCMATPNLAKAPLKCVELATGREVWSKDGFGPGGCTLVDGHVVVLSDAGDLVLVKATPTAYTEVARSHVLAGKCWNSVAISNGHVYARSTKEGVCLDLSPKTMAGK